MAASKSVYFKVFIVTAICLSPGLVYLIPEHSKTPISFTNVQKNVSDSTTSAEIVFDERRPSSIVFVQAILRHGDRAPKHFYPTDPYKNDWLFGAGELTLQGMLRCYDLGQYLRNYYHDLIGDNPNEIYIRSLDIPRVINSAECIAAGLFPGKLSRKTWPLGKWQPVPIHTAQFESDEVLSPSNVCKYAADLRASWPGIIESKTKLLENKTLMMYLERHTRNEMNVRNLLSVADNIYCVMGHNMTLPQWMPQEMGEKLLAHRLTRPTIDVPKARILSGMLLLKMLSNIHDKIQNKFQYSMNWDLLKLYLFTGRSTNMHSLMSILKVHSGVQIPLGAALIMELHQQDNHYFVKMLFATGYDAPPKTLIPPECGKRFCPLTKFEKLYGEPVQKEWDEMCVEKNHTNENYFSSGGMTPIMIGALVFLLALNLIILYKQYSVYRKLPYKEDYTLVKTQADNNCDDLHVVPDRFVHLPQIHNSSETTKGVWS